MRILEAEKVNSQKQSNLTSWLKQVGWIRLKERRGGLFVVGAGRRVRGGLY